MLTPLICLYPMVHSVLQVGFLDTHLPYLGALEYLALHMKCPRLLFLSPCCSCTSACCLSSGSGSLCWLQLLLILGNLSNSVQMSLFREVFLRLQLGECLVFSLPTVPHTAFQHPSQLFSSKYQHFAWVVGRKVVFS